ncbi:hypothetical protein CCACVL1_23826 [Corchorus capsularis]|uniref:Uncharacterized protein n=1 Tax=Corchorus capsularis TaxID=210143 RepID=A0A1R3GRX6_COCAP|nr:hypothetical protein CCACVL1_23826 [Corchorus capsularis]
MKNKIKRSKERDLTSVFKVESESERKSFVFVRKRPSTAKYFGAKKEMKESRDFQEGEDVFSLDATAAKAR